MVRRAERGRDDPRRGYGNDGIYTVRAMCACISGTQLQPGTGDWPQPGVDVDGEAEADGSGVSALSADGTILAVGATGNDATDTSAGHVRVYEWSDGSWTQLGSDIDGEAAWDFSLRCAERGRDDPRRADHNDGTGADAGHVRVYQWDAAANSGTGIGSRWAPTSTARRRVTKAAVPSH